MSRLISLRSFIIILIPPQILTKAWFRLLLAPPDPEPTEWCLFRARRTICRSICCVHRLRATRVTCHSKCAPLVLLSLYYSHPFRASIASTRRIAPSKIRARILCNDYRRAPAMTQRLKMGRPTRRRIRNHWKVHVMPCPH